jgi:ornithine cyclodeaminase/alanine dehydrogenase-like protein (mu-crystallin family)
MPRSASFPNGGTMTLILSNDDVEKLLTMPACIEVLEEAYVELAEGRGVNRTRSDCITPTANPDAVYGLKSMDGVIPKFGIGAIRINSDIVTFPKKGNNVVREKVPAAPNARYTGLVLLFSTENGEPLAILPDGVMQRMRVGAANGLGVKYLARENAATVGILGSGWQAGAQLMAACAVRKITSVRCFSPTEAKRVAFAADMSALLGIEVIPVGQPEDAIAGADIVMCASNSLDAIFFERWVAPGVHLSSIKPAEIEAKAVARADRIVIHSHDTSPLTVTTRELALAKKANEHGWSAAKEINFAAFPTLPDLIVGRTAGRKTEAEVTCFINNIGLGYQFAAAGAVVYRNAKDSGLGHDLPTDWFTEDVHP